MRRSFTIISLLVALAVLFTAMPVAARSKIALGVSNPKGTVEDHIAQIAPYAPGYKPALWSLWSNWGSRDGTGPNTCLPGRGSCFFPVAEAERLMSMGITPVIWWQPHNESSSSYGIPLWSKYALIANGKHDRYIKEWAKSLASVARKYKRPIIVRFAHENTGGWFPWSLQNHGNSPASFKRAWRHVVTLFKKAEAKPWVKFVWSNYLPRAASYPGDKWVDYVGVTILNFGSQKKWKWMPGQVNRAVRMAKKISKRPIMLSEVASHYRGGNKAVWIKDGYMKAYRKQPRVKAILYLDTNQPANQGRLGHPDWRLVQPQAGAKAGSALRAYGWIANRPMFKVRNGRIPN